MRLFCIPQVGLAEACEGLLAEDCMGGQDI
jgi:hypothetical protein